MYTKAVVQTKLQPFNKHNFKIIQQNPLSSLQVTKTTPYGRDSA